MSITLIPVHYHIQVGKTKFLKRMFVQIIPPIGGHLTIVRAFFVVKDVEQDLDSYAGGVENISPPCESVQAEIDDKCHNPEEYPKIMKALLRHGWSQCRG